MLTVLFYCTSV